MIDKIIALANAGYTKAEIAELLKPKEEVKEEKKETVKETPKTESDTRYDAILAELSAVKKAIYAGNSFGAEQPAPKTTDDILTKMLMGGK